MYSKIIFSLILLVTFLNTEQRPLNKKLNLNQNNLLDSQNSKDEGVKLFQKVNNLEMIEKFNNKTVKNKENRRCRRPSNEPAFGENFKRWRKQSIKFAIHNVSNKVSEDEVRNSLKKSIHYWTKSVNLTITESESDKADIIIYFTKQDESEIVLGYAYLPENGAIFFNQDKNWTFSDFDVDDKNLNFGWVAAHELGHALGLEHSEFINSIMHPYYNSKIKAPINEDIKNLQKLYGKKKAKETLCTGDSVDAIINENKQLIFIKGNKYWNYSSNGSLNGPSSLASIFPGISNQIDAAFTIHEKYYILSNDFSYRFKFGEKVYARKTLSVGFDGLPSNIDAAFNDPTNNKIYFFKGSKYFAFDTKSNTLGERLVVNGKDIASGWNGVPENLEAATLLEASKVLFVKDNKCYIVDLKTKKVLSEDDCTSNFFKC